MLRNVLVPLDGSPLAERALPIALDLARRSGAAVHLVRAQLPLALVASTPDGMITADLLEVEQSLHERALNYVSEKAVALHKDWAVPVHGHFGDGNASAVITKWADDVEADLIVMTTHGVGGFAPGWLGSVADGVIRHSHRPVLVLPENDEHQGEPFVPRSILVPLDGSAEALAVLPMVRQLALLFGASVQLIRVIAPYVPGFGALPDTVERPDPFGIDQESAEAKRELDEHAASLEQSGIKVSAVVKVQQSTARVLLDHIKETSPDLLAMATQGRGFSRFFLGSIADKLLRAAQRPTLILRPPVR